LTPAMTCSTTIRILEMSLENNLSCDLCFS
jgi:hypothetical protein